MKIQKPITKVKTVISIDEDKDKFDEALNLKIEEARKENLEVIDVKISISHNECESHDVLIGALLLTPAENS